MVEAICVLQGSMNPTPWCRGMWVSVSSHLAVLEPRTTRHEWADALSPLRNTQRVPAVPCVPWIPQQHRALPAVNVNIPVAIPVHLSALSISQTAHKWKLVLDHPLPVQPEPLGKEGSKFPLSMAWLQGQDTALWLYPTPSAPTNLFMAAAEPVLEVKGFFIYRAAIKSV